MDGTTPRRLDLMGSFLRERTMKLGESVARWMQTMNVLSLRVKMTKIHCLKFSKNKSTQVSEILAFYLAQESTNFKYT